MQARGVLFRAASSPKSSSGSASCPQTANLQFLSCGEYTVPPGPPSVAFCRPEEESLLFMWKGAAVGGGRRHGLRARQLRHAVRAARRGFRLHNGAADPPC